MPLPSHLSTVEICPACNAEWETDADRYREALERIVAEEDCVHWTGKGCQAAMRQIARVALGLGID